MPCFGKVEKSYITQIETHQNPIFGIESIIAFLHDHILDLIHQIIFFGFIQFSGNNTPDDDIGIKIGLHHIDREIIINTAVIDQYAVDFNRFEYERETHGSSHGITQITIPQYDFSLVIYIGGNRSKRNE